MERGVRGLGGEAGHAVWQHRVCTHRGGGGTLHGIANTRPSARTSRVRCRPMPFSLCAGRRSSPRNDINTDSCRHTHTHSTHSTHTANTGPHLTKRGEGGGLGGTTSRADLRGV